MKNAAILGANRFNCAGQFTAIDIDHKGGILAAVTPQRIVRFTPEGELDWIHDHVFLR